MYRLVDVVMINESEVKDVSPCLLKVEAVSLKLIELRFFPV